MTQPHSYSLQILEGHLDTFGHVNNATYLQLFEQARWEWITSRGFGMDKVMETGLGPTILELEMKFLKELRLRETITIASRVVTYEKKVGILEQTMSKSDGNPACQLSMKFGLFDTRSRKLIEPTKEWSKALDLHTLQNVTA